MRFPCLDRVSVRGHGPVRQCGSGGPHHACVGSTGKARSGYFAIEFVYFSRAVPFATSSAAHFAADLSRICRCLPSCRSLWLAEELVWPVTVSTERTNNTEAPLCHDCASPNEAASQHVNRGVHNLLRIYTTRDTNAWRPPTADHTSFAAAARPSAVNAGENSSAASPRRTLSSMASSIM